MFTNLGALFRILNFLVFIALVAYLFKKKIKHSLVQEIENEELKIKAIGQQKKEIVHQTQNLETRISTEHDVIEHLKGNIKKWHDRLEKKQAQQLIECEQTVAKINKKVEIQSTYIAKKKTEQEIVSKALVQAREQLESYFSKPQEQKSYLNPILQLIQKES